MLRHYSANTAELGLSNEQNDVTNCTVRSMAAYRQRVCGRENKDALMIHHFGFGACRPCRALYY